MCWLCLLPLAVTDCGAVCVPVHTLRTAPHHRGSPCPCFVPGSISFVNNKLNMAFPRFPRNVRFQVRSCPAGLFLHAPLSNPLVTRHVSSPFSPCLRCRRLCWTVITDSASSKAAPLVYHRSGSEPHRSSLSRCFARAVVLERVRENAPHLLSDLYRSATHGPAVSSVVSLRT